MAEHWYESVLNDLFHVPTAIRRIYILSVLRTVIVSIGGVFLPLLFFKEVGIGAVALYIISYSVGVRLAELFLFLRRRARVERDVSAGIFISSLGLIWGSVNPSLPGAVVSGLLVGIGSGFYWLVHHASYVLFGRKRDEQREYSLELVLLNVASLFTPLLVGFATLFLDPSRALFLFSFFLFLGSFLLPREVGETSISFKKFVESDVKPFTPYTILFFLDGVFLASLFLLPLFIYSTGLSYSQTAFVVTAVVLARAVADYLVGKAPGKFSSAVAVTSLFIASAMLILIFLFPSIAPLLYVLLPTQLFYLVYTAWIYEKSQEDPSVLMNRETLGLPLGKVSTYTLAAAVGVGAAPFLGAVSGVLLALLFRALSASGQPPA